jgi:hypothetical protein
VGEGSPHPQPLSLRGEGRTRAAEQVAGERGRVRFLGESRVGCAGGVDLETRWTRSWDLGVRSWARRDVGTLVWPGRGQERGPSGGGVADLASGWWAGNTADGLSAAQARTIRRCAAYLHYRTFVRILSRPIRAVQRSTAMSRRGRRGRMEERVCAVEGCGKRAKAGSLHGLGHGQSAVGQAARRELKDLLRELEKLAEVSDPRLRRRDGIRFCFRMSWRSGGGMLSWGWSWGNCG